MSNPTMNPHVTMAKYKGKWMPLKEVRKRRRLAGEEVMRQFYRSFRNGR